MAVIRLYELPWVSLTAVTLILLVATTIIFPAVLLDGKARAAFPLWLALWRYAKALIILFYFKTINRSEFRLLCIKERNCTKRAKKKFNPSEAFPHSWACSQRSVIQ